MWIRRIGRRLIYMLITVLLGGFLGATFVRMAPGFGVSEQELDSRLSEESIRALQRSRDSERNVVHFYGRYLKGLLKGELGVSHTLSRPISELLAQRIPVTFYSVALGLLWGWLLGLAFALPGAVFRQKAFDLFSTVLTGSLLCVPSAVLGLLFLFVGGPVPFAIALVVFPKVFRYVQNILRQTYAQPHVLMAQAKGLHGARILMWHVLAPAAPQILALAGVSVNVALGAAVPIEVICDSPGLGQLAWLAALGRDLPLLVDVTVLVTLITLVASSASDLALAVCTWQKG